MARTVHKVADRPTTASRKPARWRHASTSTSALRLVSAHPDYPPCERPAADVHIVGKVLWKIARA